MLSGSFWMSTAKRIMRNRRLLTLSAVSGAALVYGGWLLAVTGAFTVPAGGLTEATMLELALVWLAAVIVAFITGVLYADILAGPTRFLVSGRFPWNRVLSMYSLCALVMPALIGGTGWALIGAFVFACAGHVVNRHAERSSGSIPVAAGLRRRTLPGMAPEVGAGLNRYSAGSAAHMPVTPTDEVAA